jgi:uncharacterized protein YchJ
MASSLMRPLTHSQGRAAAPPPLTATPAGLLPCRRVGRAAAAVLVATRAAGKKSGGGGFAPAKKSGGGFGGSSGTTSSSGGAKQQQQQQQQTPDAASPCPCGSGKAYGGCCGPAHANRAPPATPELLLRSRFAAYRLGLVDYLVATTHPAAPERRSAALGLAGIDDGDRGGGGGGGGGDKAAAAAEAYRASIARTARATEFVALSIDRAGASVRPREGGGAGAGEEEEEAFLSFTVWHRPKAGGARRGGGGGGATGNESVARETSHFVKAGGEGGRWLYLGEAQETGGEEGARRAKEADAAAAAAAAEA